MRRRRSTPRNPLDRGHGHATPPTGPPLVVAYLLAVAGLVVVFVPTVRTAGVTLLVLGALNAGLAHGARGHTRNRWAVAGLVVGWTTAAVLVAGVAVTYGASS